MFFLSTFFDVGNGGILQRPAQDYDKINEEIRTGTRSASDDRGVHHAAQDSAVQAESQESTPEN